MDINLSSIIKAALIIAFILPAFSLVASTLPASPAILNTGNQGTIDNLSSSMNSTSLYIQVHFLRTVSGLNNTLNGKSGSFSANPTIFQAFAFILADFGTVMQDIVMLPYLDQVSMNYMVTGMAFSLPPYALSFIKVGMTLLNAYLIISMGILGISMIEKYNMKT